MAALRTETIAISAASASIAGAAIAVISAEIAIAGPIIRNGAAAIAIAELHLKFPRRQFQLGMLLFEWKERKFE